MKFHTALLAFLCSTASAQIAVDSSASAEEMVTSLFSNDGIFTFSNIALTGNPSCSGLFSKGRESVDLDGFPDTGVVLSTGRASLLTDQAQDKTSGSLRAYGDEDLQALLPSGTTFDACVLEFDFECSISPCPIEFEYVFGSEEYGMRRRNFNDVFAWFLNDRNIALVPGTSDEVSIVTINNDVNSEYFIDNNAVNGPYPGFDPDGFTTILIAEGVATPGLNHMKLAITDVGDNAFDSWALLKENSFTSPTTIPPPPPSGGGSSCKTGCMGKDHKVAVCHRASNKHYVSICISESALETHLEKHGDFCGCCPPDIELNHKKWCDDDVPIADFSV